jgi:hypothetical protein
MNYPLSLGFVSGRDILYFMSTVSAWETHRYYRLIILRTKEYSPNALKGLKSIPNWKLIIYVIKATIL